MPRLLLLVFAASLALVGGTAAALAWVIGSHVQDAAIDSTVEADRSVVRSFTQTSLRFDDMAAETLTAPRRTEVNELLAGLVGSEAGLLAIKVHAPDGTILFSDDGQLSGQRFKISDELAAALRGETGVELSIGGGGDEPAVPATEDAHSHGSGPVLEEYLPILSGGQVHAVFEVYRDAAPILAHVQRTQLSSLIITLAAAGALTVLLYLIFRAAQARITRQTEQLVESTRRDAHTGLLNHGAVVGVLTGMLESARTAGGAIGLALVDLDNFRLLNDTHGHGAGDEALLEVARILRSELSQASVLGRFGPDEFLIIAPPECAHDLEPAVERMRTRLADASLQFGASERLPITVSAGLCSFPLHGEAATELLSQATLALTEAKASGGDAVRTADVPGEEMRAAERSRFDVLQGLVIAVDTKDRYTKRHSEDVARYGFFLAERLELEPEVRRAVYLAGLLHDVGKIGIPDTILRKPGRLTEDEYEIVKQHVALGDLIVRELPDIELIRGGIRHHHERWDGRGYLDRLAGEEIPLAGRILAVADAFSAMTTTRPYRKALPVEEALRRLLDAGDGQLDPTLVTTFVQAMETVPEAPLPGKPVRAPLSFAAIARVA